MCVFIFVVYTVAGCAFNVVKYGARVGLEAMPHSEFWRDVPNLVREGITFSVNKVGAWCAVCVVFQQQFPLEFERMLAMLTSVLQARELLGKKPAGCTPTPSITTDFLY